MPLVLGNRRSYPDLAISVDLSVDPISNGYHSNDLDHLDPIIDQLDPLTDLDRSWQDFEDFESDVGLVDPDLGVGRFADSAGVFSVSASPCMASLRALVCLLGRTATRPNCFGLILALFPLLLPDPPK